MKVVIERYRGYAVVENRNKRYMELTVNGRLVSRCVDHIEDYKEYIDSRLDILYSDDEECSTPE